MQARVLLSLKARKADSALQAVVRGGSAEINNAVTRRINGNLEYHVDLVLNVTPLLWGQIEEMGKREAFELYLIEMFQDANRRFPRKIVKSVMIEPELTKSRKPNTADTGNSDNTEANEEEDDEPLILTWGTGDPSEKPPVEAENHVSNLLRQASLTKQTAIAIGEAFQNIITSYLRETRQNDLPSDWKCLEEIRDVCIEIGNDDNLTIEPPELFVPPELTSLAGNVKKLTLALERLEAENKNSKDENSPIEIFKRSFSSSTGDLAPHAIYRLTLLGIFYLTGVPPEAIAATAAYFGMTK